jgi:sulfite exporter TauE/SafE
MVMLLGKHRYKMFYFLGRLSSFTLAGWLAAFSGDVIGALLQGWGVSFLLSFTVGLSMILLGLGTIFSWGSIITRILSPLLLKVNQDLSLLLLKDRPFAVFLFGFFTLALPCGQTLIVFSACALSETPLIGAVNGFLFALFTSPSLFFAMQARKFLLLFKRWEKCVIGSCSILVGILAILRALAESGAINHFVLNSKYHVVLY